MKVTAIETHQSVESSADCLMMIEKLRCRWEEPNTEINITGFYTRFN